MIPSVISDEKVEQYKQSLEEPFWELHEAAYRLCGVTEFEMKVFLDPKDAEICKRKSYNLGPSCLLKETATKISPSIETLQSSVLGNLIQAIQNRQITSYELPLFFDQADESKKIYEYRTDQTDTLSHFRTHTYFLLPHEAIYIAISKGLLLPQELQIASNVYQISPPTTYPLSKGEKNEVKRDAVAQAYWWRFPNETISGICRKMNKLKARAGFDFLHSSNYEGEKRDTNMKPRISVKKMMPNSSGEITWIPEVIQRQEGIIQIDFQRLKIVFHTILSLMLLKEPTIRLEDFLAHPLISQYACGGNQVEKLARLCAQDALNDLGYPSLKVDHSTIL